MERDSIHVAKTWKEVCQCILYGDPFLDVRDGAI